MPIINGQYVYDNLGSPRDVQQQVFGGYRKGDMADYTTAAYNYLMKQQEQAYNLELWKMTNEYNTPAAMMSRYQDAGLNPNLIYSQQNAAQSPASANAGSFRPTGLKAKQTQNAISMINQFGQIVKQAKDIYDYATYGAPERQLQNQLLQKQNELANWNILTASHQETAAALKNMWEMWLQGRAELPADAPAVRRYQLQADQIDAQIRRLEAMIKMIPDQQARLVALTALDDYRLQILKGQNDAILNIHTGNDIADSFLRAFLYFGMSAI